MKDTKETADAIIHFVSYLIGILEQSEEAFTIPKFLSAVFDPDFVRGDRYAELLVKEVPAEKLLDTTVRLYRERCNTLSGEQLPYVGQALRNRLGHDDLAEFLAAVSEDLRTNQSETEISRAIQMLPPDLWYMVHDVARLRIENKLMLSIACGLTDAKRGMRGRFGTCASRLLGHFTGRQEAAEVLIRKLQGTKAERHYAATFFMTALPRVMLGREQTDRCLQALCRAVRVRHWGVRRGLADAVPDYPADWQKRLVGSLNDITDEDSPLARLPDGTPFLSTRLADEEEIPF